MCSKLGGPQNLVLHGFTKLDVIIMRKAKSKSRQKIKLCISKTF